MAKFEFDSLTLEEVELIESMSNRPIDSIAQDNTPKGASLSAIVFVINRRENPKYTPADAKKVTFKEAMSLLSQEDNEDPKEEA